MSRVDASEGSPRIAVVFERIDPTRGGAETYVADLCKGLMKSGCGVTLYASSWVADAARGGVRTVEIPSRGGTRSSRIWNFAVDSEIAMRADEAAGAFDVSIGMINTWHQDILIPQGGVRAASLRHNAERRPPGWRRTLYRLGKSIQLRGRMYEEIERRQYDLARGTMYVAPSRFTAGHLGEFQGVPSDRIEVIPNAIDTGRLETADVVAERASIRSALGLGDRDVVGLFVGHNYALKGLGPAIEGLAAHHASGRRPIHLVVCGGGKIQPYRRFIEKAKISAYVHTLGFVQDVRPYYHASDFFISPTYYDPCSLVVFEALASGLPVMTTSWNGASEVMTPGMDGVVLSRPDDAVGMAEGLLAMSHEETRLRMSKAARRTGALQTFDRHVERLLDLCRTVALRKRRRRRDGPSSSGPAMRDGSIRNQSSR